ncbi:MAG TPA: CocE/NonD family hydrolase [Polyangiales bacterium]|nr:CocE/NonD family hydrolase [Polyangiales bacterium]
MTRACARLLILLMLLPVACKTEDSRPAAATGDPTKTSDGAAGKATMPTSGDGGAGSGATNGVPTKKPFPPGAVSKPGEYSGFGEKIYSGYELSSQYVAVRDGTKLAVDLYRPKTAEGKVVETKLPVLLMHTPYNRRYFTSATTGMGLSGETYPGAAARLIEYGYVVAIADFRGVYASYGKNQGYNRGEWVDAARMDAYDIIEWLAKQPWATDKVGMWGCSATGGSQMQAASTAPPQLKAVFPMSCEFDAYPFGVPGGMSAAQGDTKAPPSASSAGMRDAIAVAVDGDEGGEQLKAAIAEHAGGVENPGYVPFRDSVAVNIPEKWWEKSSPHTYLEQINASGIAFYVALNWNEGATKYGGFFTLNNVEAPAKLIAGPAEHCAWFTVEKQTGFDIAVEERRFFDYWLKGIYNGVHDEPKVYYFTYNESAENTWRSSSAWPLPEEKRTPYFLGDKTLDVAKPGADAASDQVMVDYSATAMNLAGGLVYETAPLTAAVRITGHPVAELWVSSSAADTDVIATLQDVGPDGKAVSYNMAGRLRASLRKEASAPYNNLGLPWHPMRAGDAQPLTPDEPVQLRFDLLPISIRFPEGHRIRLVVTFADAVTPKLSPVPSVRIHRDAAHPSSITLPIIPESAAGGS